MSFSHTLLQEWRGDGRIIATDNAYTGDAQNSRDVAVPDETTDHEVFIAIDVSEIASIFIVSDQDLTLETNSAGAPDETISLLADVPYIWNTDSYFANLLATDITALFLTNASGATANFKLEVVFDSTP